MLGNSKVLNTPDSRISSNKVKDITMNYQQEAKDSHLVGWLSLIPLWRCAHLFGILRDYTWGLILNSKLCSTYPPRGEGTGWFLYSPAFWRINLFNNKLIDVRLNKLTLKKDTGRHRTPYLNKFACYSTNVDRIDPMWVTGFVDAEGCFSIIIEILEPLKWRVRTRGEGFWKAGRGYWRKNYLLENHIYIYTISKSKYLLTHYKLNGYIV